MGPPFDLVKPNPVESSSPSRRGRDELTESRLDSARPRSETKDSGDPEQSARMTSYHDTDQCQQHQILPRQTAVSS